VAFHDGHLKHAAELLSAVFDADPLSASMYGFPGYDDRLPDLSDEAEARVASSLATIAQRAEAHTDHGLAETERQTLDFATAWRELGHPSQCVVMPGLNHYDIILDVLRDGHSA